MSIIVPLFALHDLKPHFGRSYIILVKVYEFTVQVDEPSKLVDKLA